jgi:ATP-binding protein involved in chromosome partitioning
LTDRETIIAALSVVADPTTTGNIVTSGRASGVIVKPDGSAGLVLSIEGLAKDVAERLNAANLPCGGFRE